MTMKAGMFLVLVFVLAGCATAPRPAPLNLADIISMTKAGMTDQEIIRRIDDTRSVFRLSSDDVLRLRQEGVSNGVVTYILDTYIRYAMAEQRRRDAAYEDDFYFRYGFYYGHPWYRWRW